jgi:perosamine synthetase
VSGPPAARIGVFHTHVSPRAIERTSEVLRSGWLNEGAVVRDFEARLSESLGVKNPVAVNSGTSALHLALSVAGVGPGDEVILPAQTFLATGTVILMRGARPVFADIDPRSGNIDPRAVADAITERTRALLPVHWGGYPCDLDALGRLAAARGLLVIEDAAHALGATHAGRPIGSISTFTAFSFQATKHLTTGDGGALCCLEESAARDAVAQRWFGIDRRNAVADGLGARAWDVTTLGYKYHMNNVAAAIGLGNLEDLPPRLSRRREIGAYYRERLAGVAGLELLELAPERRHAYWLFTVLVEEREAFARKLNERGFQPSVVDLGIDRNTLFAPFRRDLPGQREFDRRQISLPVHDGLDDEQVERLVETIRSGW